MNRPVSAARRRKSQVFVEIPPSPHISKSGKTDRAGLPESTPLKAVVMNVDNAPSSSSASASNQLKRKSPDEEKTHTMAKHRDDAQAPRPKKPKTEHASKPDTASSAKKNPKSIEQTADIGDTSNAGKGLVRCHQCSRQMLPAGRRDA